MGKQTTTSRTLTATQLCEQITGLTKKQLEHHRKRKNPPPCDRRGGSYLYNATEYIAWMRSEGLTPGAGQGRPGEFDAIAGEDTEDLKERLLKAKTLKEEEMAKNWRMENEKLEGVLINKEEYRRLWIREFTLVFGKLRGLGSRVAARAVGKDAGEIDQIITDEIDLIASEFRQ